MEWSEISSSLLSSIISWTVTLALRIFIAIIVLFISFKAIRVVAKKIEKTGEKGKIDKTLSRTLAYAFKLIMKSLVAICIIGFVGIDTSGFAALVISLGAGVGLALNGALSNLAGGILIILTRPFRVDDFIEAQGYSGTVEDIHIITTKIRTPDNKVVYIPNGPLSSDTIVNFSVKDTRRVDFKFSISYSTDFEKAKNIVRDICTSHDLVLDEPAPFVRMSSHGQSSIDIVARVWVKSADYWTVNFDILEAVKIAFDREGIEIPFNQLDVHIKNDN